MIKSVIARILCFLSISFLAVSADAVVINFNDLEQAGSGTKVLKNYSSNGFDFTSSISSPDDNEFAYFQQQFIPYYDTSAALYNNYHDGITTLSLSTGGAFNMSSIDLDLLFNYGTAPVHFYAYDAFNAQVADLNIVLTTNGWQTVAFGSDFQNIYSLKWAQTPNYHQFDNVVVSASAVPEPATMLLLGTGLIGLAGARRKLKK